MVSAACRGLPSCALCLPVTFFKGALNCSVTNRQCRIPLCLVSAFFMHAGSRSFDRRSLSFCCGAATTFHARFMKTASEGLFSSSFSRLESNKAGLRLAGWLRGSSVLWWLPNEIHLHLARRRRRKLHLARTEEKKLH